MGTATAHSCHPLCACLKVGLQGRGSSGEGFVEEVQRHLIGVVVHVLHVVGEVHVHVTHDGGILAIAGLQVAPGPLVHGWPVSCLRLDWLSMLAQVSDCSSRLSPGTLHTGGLSFAIDRTPSEMMTGRFAASYFDWKASADKPRSLGMDSAVSQRLRRGAEEQRHDWYSRSEYMSLTLTLS